jgi:hypothetical protein
VLQLLAEVHPVRGAELDALGTGARRVMCKIVRSRLAEEVVGIGGGIEQWFHPGLTHVQGVTEACKRPEQPPYTDIVRATARTFRVIRHVVSAVVPRPFVDQLAAREAPAVGPG